MPAANVSRRWPGDPDCHAVVIREANACNNAFMTGSAVPAPPPTTCRHFLYCDPASRACRTSRIRGTVSGSIGDRKKKPSIRSNFLPRGVPIPAREDTPGVHIGTETARMPPRPAPSNITIPGNPAPATNAFPGESTADSSAPAASYPSLRGSRSDKAVDQGPHR